jgi:succinate-acetate transporter protein
MRSILDIVLWPYGVFMESLAGILYPVKSARMARRRNVAIASLAGCLTIFAIVFLLSSSSSLSIAIAPLVFVGLVLMFVFLITGKMCADEAEQNQDNKHGEWEG